MTAINRQSLRQLVRQQRRSLSSQAQIDAANTLNARLQNHPKVINANTIAIYLTNDGELNTAPFIQWCWEHKITICIPRIHPFNPNQLLFLNYHELSTMKPNRYGIMEPILDCRHVVPLARIDIMFTPLVAFDKQGSRLGMGGGFYDRTLANWYHSYQNNNDISKVNKLWPIGIAHDCQQVDVIPTEYWDVPIPEIITPSTHFQFF